MSDSSDKIVREQHPRPRLVIYPNRARMAFSLFGGLGFVALSLWLLTNGKPLAMAAGVAAILVFGSLAVYAAYRLIVPSPALVIDTAGVYDNASLGSVGFLAWDEIVGFNSYAMGRHRFLGITVADRDALLARVRPWCRGLIRLNTRTIEAATNIPQATLPMTLDELETELHNYRPQ